MNIANNADAMRRHFVRNGSFWLIGSYFFTFEDDQYDDSGLCRQMDLVGLEYFRELALHGGGKYSLPSLATPASRQPLSRLVLRVPDAQANPERVKSERFQRFAKQIKRAQPFG